MRHLDEGTVHAFVDGALDAARVREVEEHLAWCAACRDAVGEARGLVAASSRVLAALDVVPGGVLPPRRGTAPGARGGGGGGAGGGGGFRGRGFTSRWGWAAAAVMLLAAGAVLVSRSRPGVRPRATERLAAGRESAVPAAAPAEAPVASAAPALERAAPAADSVARPMAGVAPRSDSVAGVRGMARAKTGAVPRRLAVDSVREAGGVVVRTRFAWSDGVVLTLLATPPGVHAATGAAADAMRLNAAPAASEAASPVNVIEWTGADGTRYRLSGATSVAELRRARAVIPPADSAGLRTRD